VRRAGIKIFILGIPVAFNPERTIAVSVTEGDEYTGIFGDKDPKTKALKRNNTAKAIEKNAMFDDWPVKIFGTCLTYSNQDVVWAELSIPRVQLDGSVTGWEERILLGSIDGDTGSPREVTPRCVKWWIGRGNRNSGNQCRCAVAALRVSSCFIQKGLLWRASCADTPRQSWQTS